MPMYEFKCPSCEHSFEEIVRSSQIPGVTCPACGAGEPERQLSTFATVGDSSQSSGSSYGSSCNIGSGFS